jgi:hypothetical protein
MDMKNNNEEYWIRNPIVLVDINRLNYFYPQSSMTFAEQINSIIRLAIYIGIILSFVYKNYLFLYIPIIVMVGSIIVYYSSSPKVRESYNMNLPPPQPNYDYNELVEQKIKEENPQESCVPPTDENPFMNFLLSDDPRRPPACQPSNPKIKEQIQEKFHKNLFMDVNDIYNKQNSQREFYTMPSTTIPNEQGNFAKWLYGLPPTCKEGNGAMCVAGNTERLNGESYQFH